MSEHEQQKKVVQWLRDRGHIVFSVPNGAILGGRNKFALLNKLKSEGMENGAPDLIVVTLPPVAIEMKDDHTKETTPAQEEMLTKMRQKGWSIVVGYGASDAIMKLEWLGL